MLVLRDPAHLAGVEDEAVRRLVASRMAAVSPDLPCPFVVVEPGDACADVQQHLPLPLLGGDGEPVYGEPDFCPWSEWIQEHETCFEAVFITGDDGAGAVVLVLKLPGVDGGLLRMCAEFATPDPDQAAA